MLTCSACDGMIKRIVKPCRLCGLSHVGQQPICVVCLTKAPNWQLMIAPLSYQQPISLLIQRLKYNQKLDVLKILVELALPYFNALSSKPDLLVPVPLHPNRYLQRGFNQSLEIAILLSKALAIPYSDVLIERVIDTERQSELKFNQRLTNVKNAFLVAESMNNYQHIALIDDVVTTGNTVREVTKKCLKSGVTKVEIWALARAEIK